MTVSRLRALLLPEDCGNFVEPLESHHEKIADSFVANLFPEHPNHRPS